MRKIPVIYANDNGWCDWQLPIHGKGKKNYKLCCCGCGLVHNVQFRVIRGRVAWRMSLNKRSTALVRRHDRRKEQERKKDSTKEATQTRKTSVVSRAPRKTKTKPRTTKEI